MSLDVFVQYFSDGAEGKVPLNRVREIFTPYIVERDSEGAYDLFFDQLNCSYLYLGKMDENRNVEGFCINRPCADERLWKCLYECFSLGNCVIICPGLNGMLTNNVDICNHVPQDMVEGIGLKVFRDYKEFLDILNEK